MKAQEIQPGFKKLLVNLNESLLIGELAVKMVIEQQQKESTEEYKITKNTDSQIKNWFLRL